MSPANRAKPNSAALLLVNIGQLLTLRSPTAASGPRRGPAMQELGILHDAAVLCLGGKIVSVGGTKEALKDPWLKKNRKRVTEIDCQRKIVIPGFVDSHTHPAFVSPRLTDFEKRTAGATYEEIAKAGGGIRSSVQAVRAATKPELTAQVLEALQQMAAQGTTTVEAKSGYGLALDAELKSLRAIADAASRWPGTVVPTFLGAHVVPQEFEGHADRYVKLLCKKMIPAVARQKLAQFVDVFCDRGAFSLPQTQVLFASAHRNRMGLRAHISQLSRTPLAQLLSFHPASLDHLDHVGDADISALAKQNTVATLVPGANYFLGLKEYPPARKLIDAGVPVALATDYNPGSSPTPSMPFVLSLACTQMKISPAEAITAATINAACSLRLEDRKGSIERSKDADLAAFDVADYREIPYWFASQKCQFTIVGGILR